MNYQKLIHSIVFISKFGGGKSNEANGYHQQKYSLSLYK